MEIAIIKKSIKIYNKWYWIKFVVLILLLNIKIWKEGKFETKPKAISIEPNKALREKKGFLKN